jgi:hypothetical protein
MRQRAAWTLFFPLALLALFPALEPYLHGHPEDGADHHDCPVCRLFHGATATVETGIVEICLALVALICAGAALPLCCRLVPTGRGRAPPSRVSI